MNKWLTRITLITLAFLALTEWNIWLRMGLWFAFAFISVIEIDRWVKNRD